MSNVNVPIPLGDVNIEIMVQDRPVQTVAQVHLRLMPEPSLVFECEARIKLNGFFGPCYSMATLLDQGICLDVIFSPRPSPRSLESIIKFAFTPKIEPCTVVRQDGQQLQSVTFEVLNFPKFEIDDTVELMADGWRIEVTAVSDLKEIVRDLKEQGGYGVTHHGTIKRLDGKTFSIEDAENVMDCIRQFLSFARGVNCASILPVGFNSDGEAVWKQWGSPPVESWGWTPSWFDTHCSETLAEVFPGFWRCLNGGPHATAIRTALAWYLRSNRNNGDQAGGLILSQTALERLADAHGFNKNNVGSAARRICKLIHKNSIPSELPDGLDMLNEVLYAGQKNAEVNGGKDKIFDGPEALVAVRNDLVHPKAYFAGISGLKEYEAWNLAQWYVELVFLKMFGFNGKYANRLIAGRWVGHVEPVPWAPALD